MPDNPVSNKDPPENFAGFGRTEASDGAGSGQTGAGKTPKFGPTGASGFKTTASGGTLAIVPMKVVMKILYCARYARPDLIRACQNLALYFTCWTPECDKTLIRLVCYIQSTLKWGLMGWVGEEIADVSPHIFADADFAG